MLNTHYQRINYIYLFEFDPRNIDTPIDIFNDAVDETLVFLLLMLIYYKVSSDLDNQWMGLVVLLNNPLSTYRQALAIFPKLYHLALTLYF